MRLVGTSDAGWVVIDLRDVAGAIETLREAPVVLRERAAEELREQEERSALRR